MDCAAFLAGTERVLWSTDGKLLSGAMVRISLLRFSQKMRLFFAPRTPALRHVCRRLRWQIVIDTTLDWTPESSGAPPASYVARWGARRGPLMKFSKRATAASSVCR